MIQKNPRIEAAVPTVGTGSTPRPEPVCGSRCGGFSVVELLIVLTVFGTLAALAAPGIVDARSRTSVAHAADRFVLSVSVAQAMAIRYGRVGELHIDSATNRFWVEIDTTRAASGTHDTVGVVTDLGDQSIDIAATNSLLCYDPRGLGTDRGSCDSPATTVTFTRGDHSTEVNVNSVGKAIR